MSKISDQILQTYKELEGNAHQAISDDLINNATSVINSIKPTDSNSLFYVLAAINLLNAAIKTNQPKAQLFYGFFKSKASIVADIYLKNITAFANAHIYYDKPQKCLYFEVYEIIFSFHQVKETNTIVNKAATMPPIQWLGIRLQRIAPFVFNCAKELYESTNTSKQNNIKISNMTKSEINEPGNLFECPDCQHLLSPSATFCPNCGGIIADNTIIKGYNIGDTVQITHSIYKVLGKIKSISPLFISISRRNDDEVKIRINAIDSIQTLGKSDNTETGSLSEDTISVLSPQKIVDVLDDVIIKMFSILSIENKTLIPTNATVTGIDETGIVALSDKGETARLYMHMINYKKKNCPIGARLYINNIAGFNCPFSIIETTFQNLLSLLRKSILYRKGLTSKRKNTILSILKFMMEEMTSQKEAYIEFDSFYKIIIQYMGTTPKLEDGDNITDNVDNVDNAQDIETDNSTSATVFKTETERLLSTSGLTQPKVLGKINLESITGKKRKKSVIVSSESSSLEKPSILLSDDTLSFLNKKLTNLSESKCKALEKELDSLIRNGKKEECLKRSYEIINTSRPTPKYLKSYLDRIVNTEIALDHISEAIHSLALLIAFTEQQDGTSANSLGHLYITMARLYLKEENKDEALKAILYAEKLRPDNNAIKKLKDSIMSLGATEVENKQGETNCYADSLSRDIVDENISKMLLQDVEQEAHRQELLPNNEALSTEQLFLKAQSNRDNTSISYEERALLFLEAAAICYNENQTDNVIFKIAVANYARLKGNGMYTRFANLYRNNSGELSELQAYRDSACSYFVEALGIFNTLGEKNHLQEILLKYLQLHFVVSHIEGGKTPDPDWETWTLKRLQQDCLDNDSEEKMKTLLSAYITVGAAAEGAWGTLASDEDGIGPLYGKLGRDKEFRRRAYEIINAMEKSSVDTGLAPGEFLRKIFDNRQTRVKELRNRIEDCLSWDFNPFDISSFEEKWRLIDEYQELMSTTDEMAFGAINEVINILKPYAGRKENERYRNLVSSQQILIRSRRIITETTTYYGRILFFHLQEKWLKEISRQIDEKDASALPQLQISPEPRYIKLNDDGLGVIDFVVTNNGDSTAQSFVINATINGKEYVVIHEEELAAGDSCGEYVESNDFSELESADVLFKLTAKYQGRDLPYTETEATYEKENGEILTDIPWTIKSTPKETIFKGREGKLTTLISHYLSKERYMTYILYGLTRTGKTSILDYLCDRIEGKHIKEDVTKIIRTFKWSFDENEFKNIKRSDLWANLLETCIYDKLTDELANAVDAAYHEKGLPPADKLSQSDLEIFIDALNSCNIIPFIAIDEFSYIRKIIEEGVLDTTFLKKLREISYSGRACFLYAGTYDIKDIPKEYGLTGEMNNTYGMPINEIEEEYANELIDVCPNLIFDDKAKSLIRVLSGCVPYWIQWICLNCGKYAIAHRCRHLGIRDVNHVVGVMTGEIQPGKKDTWQAIDEINFYNNQIDPNNIAEQKLISSISHIVGESTHNERGVSIDELNRLWDKYNVDESIRKNMIQALTELKKRKIVEQFTDDTREVYRLNVDLFRRWWFAQHRDLEREFKL